MGQGATARHALLQYYIRRISVCNTITRCVSAQPLPVAGDAPRPTSEPHPLPLRATPVAHGDTD